MNTLTASVGYINTPVFNQNIFLNPYTVNTSLPTNGYLGNTLTGSNFIPDTTITSVFTAISIITIPKGIWMVVGYATIDCNNQTSVCATLAITDASNTNIIDKCSVSITNQSPIRQNTFTLHLTGILSVTTSTTYDLSVRTDASLSGDIFAVGTLTNFEATRIA